jgi:2C-methyl-D-erythritol 2,4-cyclodiphosphate synthase
LPKKKLQSKTQALLKEVAEALKTAETAIIAGKDALLEAATLGDIQRLQLEDLEEKARLEKKYGKPYL